jgi:hypothetical protein
MFRIPFTALILVLALAFPALSFAQTTPGDDVYDPADKRSQVEVSASGGGGGGDGGGLPFTGLEVGLVALAGAAVLGTGLVIRRASGAE